jgi:hypothetical protein
MVGDDENSDGSERTMYMFLNHLLYTLLLLLKIFRRQALVAEDIATNYYHFDGKYRRLSLQRDLNWI